MTPKVTHDGQRIVLVLPPAIVDRAPALSEGLSAPVDTVDVNVAPERLAALAAGASVVCFAPLTPDQLWAASATVRTVVIAGTAISPEVSPRWIEITTARQVPLLVIDHDDPESSADLVLALLLATGRRVLEGDVAVRRGQWRDAHLTSDLSGATVMVIGLGAEGVAVARRLRAFNCSVVVRDPAGSISTSPAVSLRRTTRFITVHPPKEQGLLAGPILSGRLLSAVPREATVVTLHPEFVDLPALRDALNEGAIRGAALDWPAQRLPVPEGLDTMPGVLMTSGLAYRSLSVLRGTLARVARDLAALERGERPASWVNAKRDFALPTKFCPCVKRP